MADVVINMRLFIFYEVRNRLRKIRLFNPVQAPGYHGFETTLNFVFTLSAGIKAFEAMLDAIIYALVVAGFKM